MFGAPTQQKTKTSECKNGKHYSQSCRQKLAKKTKQRGATYAVCLLFKVYQNSIKCCDHKNRIEYGFINLLGNSSDHVFRKYWYCHVDAI